MRSAILGNDLKVLHMIHQYAPEWDAPAPTIQFACIVSFQTLTNRFIVKHSNIEGTACLTKRVGNR